jgi:putative transposase
MARPLRIEFPSALYHVTSRGDGREDIYLEEGDRQAWLGILGAVCERFRWVCHAYCQMTNHYHLLVETLEANLSRGMRQLNGVYSQWFNRTHHRVGHVFQPLQGHLGGERQLSARDRRYVVLNPVRAGVVDDPGAWPWSSYTATIN